MQQEKIRMAKKKFRIGELSKELRIKKFVIRFWEKEFSLSSHRSHGGQRYYTEENLQTFQTIKNLLYDQGYTIAGAKGKLKQSFSHKDLHIKPATTPHESLLSEEIKGHIKTLKEQLQSLYEKL